MTEPAPSPQGPQQKLRPQQIALQIRDMAMSGGGQFSDYLQFQLEKSGAFLDRLVRDLPPEVLAQQKQDGNLPMSFRDLLFFRDLLDGIIAGKKKPSQKEMKRAQQVLADLIRSQESATDTQAQLLTVDTRDVPLPEWIPGDDAGKIRGTQHDIFNRGVENTAALHRAQVLLEKLAASLGISLEESGPARGA